MSVRAGGYKQRGQKGKFILTTDLIEYKVGKAKAGTEAVEAFERTVLC